MPTYLGNYLQGDLLSDASLIGVKESHKHNIISLILIHPDKLAIIGKQKLVHVFFGGAFIANEIEADKILHLDLIMECFIINYIPHIHLILLRLLLGN